MLRRTPSHLQIQVSTTYDEKQCFDRNILNGVVLKVHAESGKGQMLLVPWSECVPIEEIVFTQTYDSEVDITMMYFIPEDRLQKEFAYTKADDTLTFIFDYNHENKIIDIEILCARAQLEKYE